MKKILCGVSAIIILITIWLISYDNGLKYDVGKDTIKAFGDGMYQIYHHVYNGDSLKGLGNCKYHHSVIDKVEMYQEYDDDIYFIGIFNEYKVYCILNVETNQLKYYPCIEEGKPLGLVYADEMRQNNEVILLSDFDQFEESEKKNFDNLLSSLN